MTFEINPHEYTGSENGYLVEKIKTASIEKNTDKKPEKIPDDIYELISYVMEMKRNHTLMSIHLNNLEKEIETLKRKIK